MAYDQGPYQAPSRPYNGRAAAPPAHHYAQQGPPQGYGGQPQYDEYAQNDDYGYAGDYDQSYIQHHNGYREPMGNGGHIGNGYPPQQMNGRGGMDPRGGGQRGRGGNGYSGVAPAGYSGPPRRAVRGPPPQRGGGGRPGPLERAGSSDSSIPRRVPMSQQPLSPQEIAWDNPFPGFPGAKKKTSLTEEQKIVQSMAQMDMNAPANRPRTAGSMRPTASRRPEPDGYNGRQSGESQRGPPPRGAHPPQNRGAYGGQGPPPGQNPGYRPRPLQNQYAGQQDGYGAPPRQDDFGPPSRSNTYDNGPMPGPRYPVGDVGPSAPYNGPAGRMPPRPSTATGARPQAFQQYGSESQQMLQPQQQWAEGRQARISELYDDYFATSIPPTNQSAGPGYGTQQSNWIAPIRGQSLDDGTGFPPRQRVNGNQNIGQMQSPADSRAQVQPQSAVYEMVGEVPPIPGKPYQNYDQPYEQHGGNVDGYGAGDDRGYHDRQRSIPQDIQQEYNSSQNALPSRDPREGHRQPGATSYGDGFSESGPPPGGQGMPVHPPPVRAGLVQGSMVNMADSKPAPVRNYGNPSPNNPAPQVAPPPQQIQSKPRAPPAEVAPPVTSDELERLKAICRVTPNDQKAQLTLARKYIEACEVLVPQLPDGRQRTKQRERYTLDAHKMLKKLCSGQAPYPEAQFFLADCHGRGALGLEPDNKEAFTLYQSAAKAGHAAAAYRTAVCCELGNEEGGGTRKDPLKAIQWYKRAATLGDTPAMYKMGIISLKGLLGQAKNTRDAVQWLKRAAENADVENPHALHELGLLYEAEQPADAFIIRDEAYAISLFSQAAELGYKFAQFRLGCCYEYGLLGCPISPRDSIMWYSRAAVQEEHQSELALSGWYLTGSEGVLGQSDTEAYLWARKAAMAGLAKAEYAMGYFTECGIGSPSDVEGAKRWYWRAAAQNFPKARERLEDLKRGGGKQPPKARERISRSKVGKQNEGECAVM